MEVPFKERIYKGYEDRASSLRSSQGLPAVEALVERLAAVQLEALALDRLPVLLIPAKDAGAGLLAPLALIVAVARGRGSHVVVVRLARG